MDFVADNAVPLIALFVELIQSNLQHLHRATNNIAFPFRAVAVSVNEVLADSSGTVESLFLLHSLIPSFCVGFAHAHQCRTFTCRPRWGLLKPQISQGLVIGESSCTLGATKLCLPLCTVDGDITTVGKLFVALGVLYTMPADSCQILKGITTVVAMVCLHFFKLIEGAEDFHTACTGQDDILLACVRAITQGITGFVVEGNSGKQVRAFLAFHSPYHTTTDKAENVVVSCRAVVVTVDKSHLCKILIEHCVYLPFLFFVGFRLSRHLILYSFSKECQSLFCNFRNFF